MSFANRFGKGLLASLENEEEVVAEEVVETADNVEADMAEAAEVEAELAETTDAIDEGAEDAETLEEIADVLEETEQEGGADPVTAQVAEVAVEAIYKRLGLAKAKPLAHGLESFSDKATRLNATRLSVESIRETAKKVWEAIKKMFAKLKDFVVNFLKAVFNAQTKLVNRATKIKEVVGNKTAGAPKEKEVTGSFIKELAKDGSFDKGFAISSISALESYGKVAAIAANASHHLGLALDVSKLVADKNAYDSFDVNTSSTDLKPLPTPVKKYFGLMDDKDSVWVASEERIGSSIVALRQPVKALKGEEALRAIAKMEIRVVAASDKQVSKDAKAPVLTADEIVKICDGVIDGMKAFEGNKKILDKAILSLDVIVKKTEVTGKQLKEDDAEAAKRSRVVAAAVRGFGKYYSAMTTQSLRHATAVARAGLDYAQKSMAAYSKAEAAA